MKTCDVIAYFKTKSKVAQALGLSKSALSQWGDDVPELRAYQIEKITDGRLKAKDLNRPKAAANQA